MGLGKMNEEDWKGLGKELGPLGFGIWYLWNAVVPEEYGGVELSTWCIVRYKRKLSMLMTNGYTGGYFMEHTAPGGVLFQPTGYSVKCRQSKAKFMVLEPFANYGPKAPRCSTANMKEFARRWGGYYIRGDEYRYYWAVIQEAHKSRFSGFRELQYETDDGTDDEMDDKNRPLIITDQ